MNKYLFELKIFFFLFLRYSWCSSRLINEEFRLKSNVELNDMIPMGSKPSLIIGHNVGFDRTHIKEQYQLEVKENDSLNRIYCFLRVHRCVFWIQ